MTSYDPKIQDDLNCLWSLNYQLALSAPTEREANFHLGLSKALRSLMEGEPVPAEAWVQMNEASVDKACGL